MNTNMDPLQLLIASSCKIVLIDDNAKSHAPRHTVLVEPKPQAPCRWQSSPVNSPRKPGLLNALGKRGGLPPSAIDSLRSLVAPIHRQRTIPMLDHEDNDDDSHSDQPETETENLQLNQKLTNASELLSEYLRVATEELCLDYDDDGTVTTAAMTISSHSTNESSCSSFLSNKSLTSNVRKPVRTNSQSLTRNVKKPVRQRSREDLLCDAIGC